MRPRDKGLGKTCSAQHATTDMQPAVLAGRSRDSCCDDVRNVGIGHAAQLAILLHFDSGLGESITRTEITVKGQWAGGECDNVQYMGSGRRIGSSLTCGSTCPQKHWSCAPCSELGVPTDQTDCLCYVHLAMRHALPLHV